MFRKSLVAVTMAAGLASASLPAAAQTQNGLVNVAVGDVILNEILNENEVQVLNDLDLINDNQIQVQVPIGVAANVCNVSAAVLARSRAEGAGCTAESGSNALAQAIRKQHLKDK